MNSVHDETKNLDFGQALERVGGDDGLLREIAGIFLCECPEMLARIRGALDECNAATLERAAHNLKGSVANFGCGPVFRAARDLELAARRRDLAGAEEWWTKLNLELDSLIAELKSLA